MPENDIRIAAKLAKLHVLAITNTESDLAIREKCDGLCMNYYIVIFKIYSHTINNFIIKFKVKIKIISLHLHYESQDMF